MHDIGRMNVKHSSQDLINKILNMYITQFLWNSFSSGDFQIDKILVSLFSIGGIVGELIKFLESSTG